MYDFWQVIAVSTGAIVIIMIGWYSLVLRPAIAQKRRLSASIHEIGTSPREIVEAAWTGKDFTNLNSRIEAWTEEIRAVSRRHKTYPLLHYFSTASDRNTLSLAMANLDDASSVLMIMVPDNVRPPVQSLRRLRDAIDRMISTLPAAGIDASDTIPPLPKLPDQVPAPDAKLVGEFNRFTRDRRRMLLAWVRHDGREWREDDGGRLPV